MLSVVCSCGVTFLHWVTLEERRRTTSAYPMRGIQPSLDDLIRPRQQRR